MITLKWWEFALLMLLSGIVSAAVSDVVHAGTTMQNLKESTKKSPGPLYGVSSHTWAALAVAVYYAQTN